ncbi:MAG TPA: beta-galactosidase [Verrucomicrobiae bacterium]|nr:beta-galactosidase [Verrucomicrobiae bacterium]
MAAWLAALAFGSSIAAADCYSVTVSKPQPPFTEDFKMGTARQPDGATLTLDSSSLLLNGKRSIPVMGEFHFSRYPENEWREELLKMKAGGVDIVSTYVFWIHHEEIEGQFDWSGSRNLRHFIQLCGEVGLESVVRCGPWDHGEARNGGFPDWLLKKGWKTRSNDTNYLAKVAIFYGEIAKQLHGLFWKDGGPVIGIQFENEYNGPAAHLMTLKRIGVAAGLDAPLYTRTGWNQPSGQVPFGQLIPLYGVYAEGFWDRVLTPMPAGYWKGFHFSNFRMDDATFEGPPGEGGSSDPPDAARYPYLTCEIGGGMMNSYHRRILIDPRDIESTTLIKLGSGSALPGYYMYHGGVNPDGKLTTLMESQATGYWNDIPVKNYDFQAPIGQYGQIREQYHRLRRLHLFLHEWGSVLGGMPATMPDQLPRGKNDFDTLRWSVRSDGDSGFVFVNNYERLHEMPPKKDVQFAIHLPAGPLTFPKTPITIPSGACFIWPFNFYIAEGVRLLWATAQPLTAIDDTDTRTVFFAKTEGVDPQFALNTNSPPIDPGNFTFRLPDGRLLRAIVLDNEDSLHFWKGNWRGRDRVFLTKANLLLDGDILRLTSTNPADLSVAIYPPPASVQCDGHDLSSQTDGIFRRFTPLAPDPENLKVTFVKVQSAGPPREIPLGKIDRPVATAPLDSEFESAAVWRVTIPAGIDLRADPILRFHYVGDVARVTLDGKLITDDFYNGNALDVGLSRHAPGILASGLRIAILPLRKDAPIYMAQSARPDFANTSAIANLQSIEIVPRYQTQLTSR